MDYQSVIQDIQTASAQVDALTAGALATDAANQSMQAALRAARVQLAAAQAAIIPPSSLNYAAIAGVVGQAITPGAPAVTGAVTGYAVSPALPAGLALDAATGIITGTPTAAAASASYTVTASNLVGSTSAAVAIAVVAAAS